MIRQLTFVLFTFVLLSATSLSLHKLSAVYHEREAVLSDVRNEMFLFPNGTALQALTFGYQNFVANLLWFKTVSYFGKHYQGDQQYEWLAHMCSTTITLDPHARHIPEFCTLMLAWESNNAEAAIAVLDQAIAASPYWRYYYLRGISNILFRKDTQAAKQDFLQGAQQDGAPQFLIRLATKTVANLENPRTAINFLKAMIARSGDPNEKESLRKHLRRTEHEQRADYLLSLVDAYRKKHGKVESSLRSMLGPSISLEDPYGGTYFWHAETQKIESSSEVPTGKIVSKSFEKRIVEK